MKASFNQLQLQKLDQHITGIRVCERPSDGWVRAIRKALGMTANQLAKRMRVSQQAVSQLESKEMDGSVTLKKLRETAEAMDCRLVYAFIPNNGSLQNTVKQQAIRPAGS